MGGNTYKTYSKYIPGASHIKNNKVCQDYSSNLVYKDKFAIVAVADGHGSDKYIRSDRGSSLACETALESAKRFLDLVFVKKTKEREKFYNEYSAYLRQLATNIITLWRTKVEDDYAQNQFTDAEKEILNQGTFTYDADNIVTAYGTTLILVVACPDFWFGLQIGDGKCVLFKDFKDKDAVCQPIPWDDKCFLNRTTSLCDTDALNNFRYCFEMNADTPPLAFFLGSDGIDDSFANDEQLYDFYRKIVEMYQQYPFSQANNELESFLPKLSERGSGDDISIAFAINNELVNLP